MEPLNHSFNSLYLMSLQRSFEYLENDTNSLEELLKDALEKKSSSIYNDDLYLLSLRLSKLTVNMNHARSALLELEPFQTSKDHKASYRSRLRHLNERVQQMTYRVKLQDEEESQENAKRKSKNLTQEPIDQVSHLTQRGSNKMTVDEKLSIDKSTQEELSSDLLSMASAIKQNAVKFNEKMAADEHVLKQTSDSLYKTSNNMDNVGQRLSKYRSSAAIGWWFYIWAVIFLIAAMIGGMITIRLFPKW